MLDPREDWAHDGHEQEDRKAEQRDGCGEVESHRTTPQDRHCWQAHGWLPVRFQSW